MAVSGSTLFAGTVDGVYLSANNGNSWTQVNSGLPTNTTVQALAVSGSMLFAGTYGNGVYLSVNNGTSWTAVNMGFPANTTINALALSGSNLFAGTPGNGVYLSANNGSSWTAVNMGLTNMYVRALAVNGSTLFAGTYCGSVWQRPLNEVIGINELTTNKNISVYPNPVAGGILHIAPSATGACPPLHSGVGDFYTIELYNLLGQQVLQTKTTTGTIDVSALEKGMYFLRLTDKEESVTEKILIQ